MSPDSPNTASLSPQTSNGSQFRLRTLLIVLSLFAVACGVTAPYFRSLNPLEWRLYGVAFASASVVFVCFAILFGGLYWIRRRQAGLVYATPKRRYLLVALMGPFFCVQNVFQCVMIVLQIHLQSSRDDSGLAPHEVSHVLVGSLAASVGSFSALLWVAVTRFGVSEVRENGVLRDGGQFYPWLWMQNVTRQEQLNGLVCLKIRCRWSNLELYFPTEQAAAVQQFIEQRISASHSLHATK